MKKTLSFLIAALFISVVQGFSQPKTLTILHTNDIHAGFIPHEAFWMKRDPKPMVGGFKELFFVSDSIKKTTQVLMLDGGDLMTGNPITEYTDHGVYGGALMEMMNAVGYDAWCLGNHDFDATQKNLLGLTGMAKCPTLSANIVNAKGEFPLNNKPFTIIEKNGIKIGIIGLMSQGLYNLVNQSNLEGIKVLSPSETVQKYIDEIDAKTDLIIVLSHEGVDDDSALAMNVHGLDIIVGGHSHTRLNKPKIINNVIIVQAGANCENLGQLDITVENDKVTTYNGKLIQLWARNDHPQNTLTNFIDSVQQVIDKDYSAVLADLKSDWKRGDGETNIGDFICDAQRDGAMADVAFTNTHGIRKDVSAGPLTKRGLFEVLPFQNMVVTFQLSGKQLRTVVENDIKNKPAIQTSGIKCQYKNNTTGGIDFITFTINGKPVEDDKMYICTASDFFMGEAKRYLGVDVTNTTLSKSTVFNVVEAYAKKMKVIDSKVENRIEEVK